MSKRLIFRRRDADQAYTDTNLWIPKSKIEVNAVKAGLEFTFGDEGGREVNLWEESNDHLIVPRQYLEYNTNMKMEVEALRPDFVDVSIEDRMIPRDKNQAAAWDAYREAECGILNLACGIGKTALSCKKIAHRGKPAIVVVDKKALLDQWVEELVQFTDLTEDQIGLVQGKTFDWEKPVVMAMINTLALHRHKWPDEFRRYYGTVIFDEVHHLSAPLFSKTADLFWGNRYGLTATPEREDGTEDIYFMHLGPIFHSCMEQELVATIYFQQTAVEVDMNVREVKDRFGNFNFSRFWAYLAQMPTRVDYILEHVKAAKSSGRKILVLSHSKGGVKTMHAAMPDSGLMTGDVAGSKRLQILRNNQVVFATMNVALEAMNAPALDTIMFTTPFKNKRALIQGVGRILREHKGKQDPMAIVFEDTKVGPARSLCYKLKKFLREQEVQINIIPVPE